MICPGCGKQINIADVRQYPKRYYLYAQGGIPWHDVCVRKVLAGWADGVRWLRKMRGVI